VVEGEARAQWESWNEIEGAVVAAVVGVPEGLHWTVVVDHLLGKSECLR
jgi:hypothetical protein